ncbi:enoyl-CoA hydratase [uncultured Cohaesibacter sp.]|uniref:enoyl-CoA hydratase n=1 Tax=uncultured Cohaesibacter sp. TaxID=1002546 RepID=UPI002AAAB7D2|nr:enoyl-CoA hydratase [uncultured Cohaesibacter sp.]
MTTGATNQEDALLTEQVGPVRRLIMNRPKSRNALSEEMITALDTALDKAESDAQTRVIVLAANGPVYSAGHDLKELNSHRNDADKGEAFFGRIFTSCSALMQKIQTLSKIVIAEIQGTATAAGCQLVASCDLAITVNEADFGTPGINIGLFCTGPGVALTRSVPRKQAMELLVTGEMIDAHTAKAYGIVNRVVPKDYLRIVVDKYAIEIANKSAEALTFGKRAVYRQDEMPLADAYALATDVMTNNLLADDAVEGVNAFIEKRKPDWPSLK